MAQPQCLLLRWCQAIASGHTDRRRIAVIRSLFMPSLQLATLWHTSSILRHRPDLLQISRGAGEGRCDLLQGHRNAVDRKSVVRGKSVSVRVELGGRRMSKKNKKEQRNNVAKIHIKK